MSVLPVDDAAYCAGVATAVSSVISMATREACRVEDSSPTGMSEVVDSTVTRETRLEESSHKAVTLFLTRYFIDICDTPICVSAFATGAAPVSPSSSSRFLWKHSLDALLTLLSKSCTRSSDNLPDVIPDHVFVVSVGQSVPWLVPDARVMTRHQVAESLPRVNAVSRTCFVLCAPGSTRRQRVDTTCCLTTFPSRDPAKVRESNLCCWETIKSPNPNLNSSPRNGRPWDVQMEWLCRVWSLNVASSMQYDAQAKHSAAVWKENDSESDFDTDAHSIALTDRAPALRTLAIADRISSPVLWSIRSPLRVADQPREWALWPLTHIRFSVQLCVCRAPRESSGGILPHACPCSSSQSLTCVWATGCRQRAKWSPLSWPPCASDP